MTAPPKPRGTRPTQARPELIERRAKALTMRNAGTTWARIAEQLNISEQQARNDVVRAVKENVRITAEQMMDRQRGIFNDLIRVNYSAALDRTAPDHFQAQDRILEVLRDEARLFGLNRPAKIEVGISEAEFGKAAAELLAITGREPLLELTRAAGQDIVDAELIEPVQAAGGGVVGESWSNL